MKPLRKALRSKFHGIFILLIALCLPTIVHAQLVADGQTAILDAVATNIADNVTIGTNGSLTLLVVTNAAVVTNSGMVAIGFNTAAANNRLAVGGAGSTWVNTGVSLNVGYSGSFNEMDIVSGGAVTDVYGYIGYQSPSASNTVVVSDSGSVWQSGNLYLGQSGGANNQLIITNGGRVVSSTAGIGTGGGRNNSAIVTGANSVWTNSNGLAIGAYGPNSLLLVANGGKVFSGTFSGIGMQGASSISNLTVITGPGSSWNCSGAFYIGNFSSGNELDILNGAKVADATGYIGQNPGITNNLVVVSGSGSVWTNGTVYVGNSGPRNALIITNGGQVYSPNNSYIGQGTTSSNNVAVISGAGSLWNSGYFHFGYINPGGHQLSINKGGTLILPFSVYDHGSYCNSNLATVADAGSSLQCQIFRLAYSSTGNECVVSNGATLAALGVQASVVEGTSTRMTITGAGSLWTNAADLQFGQDSNVLAILNGGTVVDNNGFIQNATGFSNGKPNTAIVAGTNSLWKNLGDFHLTDIGGQLLITNGGTLSDNYGYFGDANFSLPNTNGFALVSGPGSLWTNRFDFYIGYNGRSNQIVVTDFGALRAQTLFAGYNGNRNQLVVSNAGNVNVRNLVIGNAANSQSNSVTLSGGTITVTNGSTSLIQYGTLTVNSGLFATPFIGTDVSGPIASKIILNGGTFQSGATSYRNSAPFAVGDGTNAATYEMLFETSPNLGTHSFPGGVVVPNNGLLKGFGTLQTNVSVNSGGTIAPGTTNIGAITALGNLTLNPGSTTLMKLSALSGTADALIGMNNVFYGGTLQLTNLDGSLAAGNSFKLFNATNYFGAFNNLLPASPGAGLRWDTNELNIDGVLRVFPAVTPAPAFGSATLANGNLTVSATGGIPYDPCYLLTCTNLPAAPADWSCVATNYFDASGTASFTNAVPPAEPQRYFQLQVN